MRHNKKIAIRVIKCLFSHWLIGRVHVNSKPILRWWVTSTCHSHKSFYEIHLLSLRYWRDRFPSQLVGMKINMMIVAYKLGYDLKVPLGRLILSLTSWRSDLVHPHLLIVASFNCEGSPWQLLCVESELKFYRTVLGWHKNISTFG